MARQSLNALEAIRDDSDDEVSSTIPSARMTSMSMTLVDDFKCVRAKRGLEPRSYLRDARVVHRSP
jgi:hypothetical protein